MHSHRTRNVERRQHRHQHQHYHHHHVEEDQEKVLLAVEDPELQNVLRAHWGSVRIYIARGPVQTRFNYRLVSRNTRSMELLRILEEHRIYPTASPIKTLEILSRLW